MIRRAVKRRHAHPLVSRLEKDYLSSPTYHRSSPNLYQPNDVVGGVGPVVTGVLLLLLLSNFFFFNFLLMAVLLSLNFSLYGVLIFFFCSQRFFVVVLPPTPARTKCWTLRDMPCGIHYQMDEVYAAHT